MNTKEKAVGNETASTQADITAQSAAVDTTSSHDLGKTEQKKLLESLEDDPVLGLPIIIEATLIKNPQGVNYIRYKKSDETKATRYEAITSPQFKADLTYDYIQKLKIGNQPTNGFEADVKVAINILDIIAARECKAQPIYNRFASVGNTVYLSLNDDQQRVVEVTANGWKVIDDSPVPFIHPATSLALPEPVRGGNINDLKNILNVSDDGFIFIVAWLLMVLSGKGPYPVLNLIGQSGSSKTTTAEILRMLIDAVVNLVISPPTTVKDLEVIAHNNAVVNLNNMSEIKPNMSDALCRISTEGGSSKRQLYTDNKENQLDTFRPVIINGIAPIVTRGDLQDRTLFVHIEKISKDKRLTKRKIKALFEEKRAGILGSLLDGVVSALKNYDNVHLELSPRMADFAHVIVAAAPGMNGLLDKFIEKYEENQNNAIKDSLESYPAAQAIIDILSGKDSWEGSMTTLLTDLKGLKQTNYGKLPKSVYQLRSDLAHIEPLLSNQGIIITHSRTANERKLTLTKKVD